MKTPEEIQAIIDTLPESKRKRALVELARKGVTANSFWDGVANAEWSSLAQWLLDHDLETHADAVWEG